MRIHALRWQGIRIVARLGVATSVAALSAFTQTWSGTPSVSAKGGAPEARVREAYGKVPLSFEANRGQADGNVAFLARVGGHALFLTPAEAVLTLPGISAVRMRPVGANRAPKISGQGGLRGRSH